MILIFYFSLFTSIKVSNSLNNGLALTPPMGWLSWGTFGCNINCKGATWSNCLSETLFKEMADILIEQGYRSAGYEYVNIDDCWMRRERDENGVLQADRIRFPNGIKSLARYMHSKDLKFGIYQDFGTKTCMGFPGSVFHMEIDVKTFADWEVDMVKLDSCYAHGYDRSKGYMAFGNYLSNARRSILYSCSWPFYQLLKNEQPNYHLISTHCNMWRNYWDIENKIESVRNIIDFFGDNQEALSPFVGPGRWNDPDMLMIGNGVLTPSQSRIQMAVWSVLPAPLLISADLRIIKPAFKTILLNKRVILINQDHLGLPGKRFLKKENFEIWRRKTSPVIFNEHSFVLLFINWKEQEKIAFKFNFTELSFGGKGLYKITDVFNDDYLGRHYGNSTISISVSPMDVIMLHCILQPRPNFESNPVLIKPPNFNH